MKSTNVFDELSAENKKLREAIQAQTIELERKNRELEIEAALERVRVVAMAMRKPEDVLNICEVVFNALQTLGFETMRSAIIHVFEDDKKYFTDYNYSDLIGGTIARMPITGHSILEKFIAKIRSSKDSFFEVEVSGEEFESLKVFRKATDMHKDPRLDTAKALYYYVYSVGAASIGISSFQAISPAQLDLLKRFRNVFNLAYGKYADIQKAEAQAREAQIEAALERVRAKTMAMRRSDELGTTSLLLFDELKALGEISEQISIGIFDEENQVLNLYATLHGEQWKEASKVDLDEPHAMQKIYGGWRQNKKSTQIDLSGDALKAYNHFRSKYSNLKFPDERWVIHCAFFSRGVLSFSTTTPHDEQTMQLLERFAQVFEGTYTRFLDLQKAEAQAREAKIEAALERIRAQSMMMQHSDELNTTSHVFHEQLLLLGLPSELSYVWLPDEANGTHMFWATWSENNNGTVSSRSKAFTYPLDKSEPYTAACFEMWESDEDVFVNRIQPEEVVGFFSTWSELVGEAENLKAEKFPDGLYYAEAYMKYGCFGINIRRPLDEAEQEVLHRFANEFERTYTRFLDLQKAEEQARKIKLVNQENERLLHSILPQPIAEQIRSGQPNVVKRFEEVSILFADIVGFTVLSEKLKPVKVVDILNGLFSKFDDLTDQYGLEKIKTIGDAYMVAAGVPEENADHAMTLFRFAQDMLLSLEEFNQSNNGQMKLRIGISSGPVVAGVIGKKKFAYDLWGDSVNTAARMEAYGQEGKIQVSPTSYELLKNDFAFEKIPGVKIKGKGMMDVYLWKPQALFGAT